MRAVSISLLFVALLASVSAGETKNVSATANSLVVIRLAKPSAVIVQKPLALKYEAFHLSDGSQAVVFSTGSNKQVVLTTFCNGQDIPEVTQWVVQVDGPGPEPGPAPPTPPNPPDPTPPDPDLSKIARTIQTQGRSAKVSRETAQALASNYENVATRLAAVSSFTVREAQVSLISMNRETTKKHPFPRAAKKLETAINKFMNEQKSRAELRAALSEVAEGYRAI